MVKYDPDSLILTLKSRTYIYCIKIRLVFPCFFLACGLLKSVYPRITRIFTNYFSFACGSFEWGYHRITLINRICFSLACGSLKRYIIELNEFVSLSPLAQFEKVYPRITRMDTNLFLVRLRLAINWLSSNFTN